MRVVRGSSEQDNMGAEEFEALLAGYDRLVVDVGTGDGKGAYRRAAADPTALHVGCDLVADAMAPTAARAGRKPARGGLPNLLLVVADVERPPGPLQGRADEVWCVLPWGRLLEGLVTGDRAVLAGLRGFARPGAALRIVLNVGVWDASTPIDVQALPEVTVERVQRDLASAYADAGLTVVGTRPAAPSEVRALRTTWAGRLTHGGGGRFLRIDASAR